MSYIILYYFILYYIYKAFYHVISYFIFFILYIISYYIYQAFYNVISATIQRYLILPFCWTLLLPAPQSNCVWRRVAFPWIPTRHRICLFDFCSLPCMQIDCSIRSVPTWVRLQFNSSLAQVLNWRRGRSFNSIDNQLNWNWQLKLIYLDLFD